MKAGIKIAKWIIFAMFMPVFAAMAQISPGDLAEPHSALEGMSNCTQCHTLGSKVSNEKCLACHTEIKERTDAGKGYHSSSEVSGKSCVTCHNDHHGRSFEIIRFEKDKFNHKLTGYELLGAHAKKSCADCHKPDFIADQKIKKKKYNSYLGLNTSCLACHKDYHQGTLASSCLNCHTYEAFKPASNFDHKKTRFPLEGKHATVECINCHKLETKNGAEFRKYAGIPFASCTNCHKDVHNNQFGQDCRQCHTLESFHQLQGQGMKDFDHNLTGFRLENKHAAVTCKSCHKTALTDPVKHDRCTDCHVDYHNNQFEKAGVKPDCSECHDTRGFTFFSYSIDSHNKSTFPLEGAHVATPCFDCHKKTEKWSFREIGTRCVDCHEDIHSPYMGKEYYPQADCRACHSTDAWNQVKFDHNKTDFVLEGKHLNQSCRACHFTKTTEGTTTQRFSGLTTECTNCHKDVHVKQFEFEGITDCKRCHGFENWKAGKFDHNNTRFILDGKHVNVACDKCHKTIQEGDLTYVQYKLKEFKCESCHH